MFAIKANFCYIMKPLILLVMSIFHYFMLNLYSLKYFQILFKHLSIVFFCLFFSVSSCAPSDVGPSNNTYKMDTTLDCVPVRQPRNEKTQEKFVPTNLFPTKVDVTNIPKPSPLELQSVMLDKVSIPVKSYAQMAASKTVNQNTSKKIFSSSKPTDILLKNLQSSLRLVSEDTECSMENSLSISKIADYLGIAFKIIVVYYVIDM